MNKHFWNGVQTVGLLLFFGFVAIVQFTIKDDAPVETTFAFGFILGILSFIGLLQLLELLKESWK